VANWVETAAANIVENVMRRGSMVEQSRKALVAAGIRAALEHAAAEVDRFADELGPGTYVRGHVAVAAARIRALLTE